MLKKFLTKVSLYALVNIILRKKQSMPIYFSYWRRSECQTIQQVLVAPEMLKDLAILSVAIVNYLQSSHEIGSCGLSHCYSFFVLLSTSYCSVVPWLLCLTPARQLWLVISHTALLSVTWQPVTSIYGDYMPPLVVAPTPYPLDFVNLGLIFVTLHSQVHDTASSSGSDIITPDNLYRVP